MKDETVESLWREHYPAVVRTAYLLTGNLEDARDLAQDAFVAAVARWGNRQVEDYAEAWLQRVVRNRTVSLFRHQRVRRNESAAPTPGSSDSLDSLDPALVRAIASLPHAQRAAFVCRYYLDYSVEEASRVLGKRPGTVRALTTQAATKLRQQLFDGVGPEEKGDSDVEFRRGAS